MSQTLDQQSVSVEQKTKQKNLTYNVTKKVIFLEIRHKKKNLFDL